MSDTKKLFLESVLYNAAKMAGDTSGIMPELETIKNILGVDIENIAENNRRLQLKELETEKENAAEKLAALGAGYKAAEPGKRQDIIDGIQREYETLRKTVTTGPQIITSKALMQTQYPPRQWIVENLIGPGLAILSGGPKIGKSWLMFALAEAAATGGVFLDKYKVNKTSVLHLSLEDTPRSIKERREILAHKQGEFIGNDNLFIATQWEAGPSGLENYLRAHNEIKLVIIDTLGRFMPDIEDMNDYAPAVKALANIKQIADSLDIAILVVHHAKKGSNKNEKADWMDQSLGSQGIVGSADTIILLQRDISDNGERVNTGRLYATGRSIKDVFHSVEYSPDFGMWGIVDKVKRNSPGQSGNSKDKRDYE